MEKLLNECIIVSKEINDKFILAKNRDRAYNPKLQLIHSIVDGVEMVYLQDLATDWSEGMNEYGIGLVNTALMVGYDELEKKIVKKRGKPSKDGVKIRKVLSQKNIKDAVKIAVKYNGGIKGHTLLGSPDTLISIESTSKHSPKIKIVNKVSPLVRTNHGHIYTDAGYTDGDNYKSSMIRKISTEKSIKDVDDWQNLSSHMRKKYFKDDSNLNMKRDTEKMKTSSQLVMNLTDKIVELTLFNDNIESFEGIKNLLPTTYSPKIKIKINRI